MVDVKQVIVGIETGDEQFVVTSQFVVSKDELLSLLGKSQFNEFVARVV